MKEEIYYVYINGEGKVKKFLPTTKLSEVRKNLNLLNNDYFYCKKSVIENNDENDFSIQDIATKDNNIIIKSKLISKPELLVEICKKNGDKIAFIKIENEKITLDKIRNSLKNKIKFNFKFLIKEKLLPIDYEDEYQYSINEILNNKKIFISQENNQYIYNKSFDEGVPPPIEFKYKIDSNFISPGQVFDYSKIIFIKLNDNNIGTLNVNLKENLASLRNKLYPKINNNDSFFFKSEYIDFERETSLKIEDILIDEVINMKTKNNEDYYRNPPQTNRLYNIDRNGSIDQMKLNSNLKLDKLRIKLKLKQNELFYLGGQPIQIFKEKKYTIDDIQNERTIEINDEEEKDEENNNYNSIYDNNFYNGAYTEYNASKRNFFKNEYIINLNGRIVHRLNLSPNESLNSVRKWLNQKISENDLFKHNDKLLDLDEEEFIIVNDVAKKNQIFIEKKEIEKKKKKNLTKPIEGSQFIREENEIKFYKYPSIEFKGVDLASCKTIMVVGETGSGKTTLLNSLVNFIVGIELDDPIRYIIIDENKGTNKIDQSKSQTSNVNAYYIKKHGEYPPLRIIDTPGFGDTRGLNFDKKITKLIKEGFETKFDSINAICFVAQSTKTRLTTTQKFIFSEIMDLFGKDVAENFIIMLTFCDANEPLIIDNIKSKDSVLCDILPHLQQPWHLKFNNSGIFATIKDNFTELYWEIGMESFKIFLQKILSLPRKSLVNTREVLKTRESIENTILNLRPKLDTGLTLMESIKKQIKIIEMNKDIINKAKNFEIKTTKPEIKKIDLPAGIHTTTCLTCNRTCHENCLFADDKEKIKCCAMNKNGYCHECPKKCFWNMHKNTPYKLIFQTKQVNTTIEELKSKYYNARSQLSTSEQIIIGMEKDFKIIEIECLEMQENIKNNLNKLEEIALNTKSHQSTEEYLKLLIINEENEKKEGYLDRIKALKELQKQNDIIKNLYNQQNLITEFNQFKKDYIEKKKIQLEREMNVEFKEEKNCNIF